MRIISGYLKGKKLVQPSDKTTRPLKDIVKEGVFNIVAHSNKFSVDLKNSKILDLFSGVGSFGLECLSRGADHVTFVENYSKTQKILEQNIQNFKLKDKSEVITTDIYTPKKLGLCDLKPNCLVINRDSLFLYKLITMLRPDIKKGKSIF